MSWAPTGRDRNIGFIGAPGTGKTYAAARLALPRARVVWVDPTGTTRLHRGQLSLRGGPGTPRTLDRIYRAFDAAHVVIYTDHDTTGTSAVVDEILEWAFAWPSRITVVVDEFKLAAPSGRCTRSMDRALRAGRHVGVSVWPISQRPVDMGPDIRSCMDEVWIFRCPERVDHDALAKIDRPLAARARRLPNREAIVLDTSTGEWRTDSAP